MWSDKVHKFIVNAQLRSAVNDFSAVLLNRLIFLDRMDLNVQRIKILPIRTPTLTRTIEPAGEMLAMYEAIIPNTTDPIDKEIEIKAVLLNPKPNSIAVILGRTINADIRRTPTKRIDVTTVTADNTINR